MFALIFVAAIAVLVTVLQLRQYHDFRKRITRHADESGESVQATELTSARIFGMFVPSLICLAVAVYILLVPDAVEDRRTYLLLTAVLGIVFAGSALTCNMTQRLYYTRSGFFIREGFVPFREVKQIEANGRKADAILLQDGTRYTIARRQREALDELRRSGVCRLAKQKHKK